MKKVIAITRDEVASEYASMDDLVSHCLMFADAAEEIVEVYYVESKPNFSHIMQDAHISAELEMQQQG